MPDEAEVKALAEKLGETKLLYESIPRPFLLGLPYFARAIINQRGLEALARVALEFCEERRQEYIDRLNNRAIGQSYREED